MVVGSSPVAVTNKRINYLHERAVRLFYDDFELTVEELLEEDGPLTIYCHNIRIT